jgi:long-chain fatty acid transport protein
VIPATPRKHLSAGFGYAVSPLQRGFRVVPRLPGEHGQHQPANTSAPIRVSHAQDNATLAYTYRF